MSKKCKSSRNVMALKKQYCASEQYEMKSAKLP